MAGSRAAWVEVSAVVLSLSNNLHMEVEEVVVGVAASAEEAVVASVVEEAVAVVSAAVTQVPPVSGAETTARRAAMRVMLALLETQAPLPSRLRLLRPPPPPATPPSNRRRIAHVHEGVFAAAPTIAFAAMPLAPTPAATPGNTRVPDISGSVAAAVPATGELCRPATGASS